MCILCVSLGCTKCLIQPGRGQYFVLSCPLAPLWAQVWTPWERPVQNGGYGLGVHVGVFANLPHGLERAVTSGELFLCTLQMCVCPKTDRTVQIPRVTNHETHSKCTQGESFAKVNVFLPFFSVRPWCVEVGHAVTWRVCPCPGCPGGCWQHRDVPRPLQHHFLMPLSWSLRKMKRWFRLKGQCYLIWKITPAIITLFLSLWWQKRWQKLEQKEIGWHK